MVDSDFHIIYVFICIFFILMILGYFSTWGIIFIIITTLVAIFKSEKNCLIESNTIGLSIIKTYKSLFSIMKLPNVKKLAIILLTTKVSKIIHMYLSKES